MSARQRVLILEDEPLIAMLMQDWLEELGYEPVGPAASIKDAQALIDAGPALAAAILDVSVKDGSSFTLAAGLQQQGVPFAFATGHGAGGIDGQFKTTPVLEKPFEFQAVKDALARLLP